MVKQVSTRLSYAHITSRDYNSRYFEDLAAINPMLKTDEKGFSASVKNEYKKFFNKLFRRKTSWLH